MSLWENPRQAELPEFILSESDGTESCKKPARIMPFLVTPEASDDKRTYFPMKSSSF